MWYKQIVVTSMFASLTASITAAAADDLLSSLPISLYASSKEQAVIYYRFCLDR